MAARIIRVSKTVHGMAARLAAESGLSLTRWVERTIREKDPMKGRGESTAQPKGLARIPLPMTMAGDGR